MQLDLEEFEEHAVDLENALSRLNKIRLSVVSAQRFLDGMCKEGKVEDQLLTRLYTIIRRPGFIDELCGHPIERSTEMDKLARVLEDILRRQQDYWVRTLGMPVEEE